MCRVQQDPDFDHSWIAQLGEAALAHAGASGPSCARCPKAASTGPRQPGDVFTAAGPPTSATTSPRRRSTTRRAAPQWRRAKDARPIRKHAHSNSGRTPARGHWQRPNDTTRRLHADGGQRTRVYSCVAAEVAARSAPARRSRRRMARLSVGDLSHDCEIIARHDTGTCSAFNTSLIAPSTPTCGDVQRGCRFVEHDELGAYRTCQHDRARPPLT